MSLLNMRAVLKGTRHQPDIRSGNQTDQLTPTTLTVQVRYNTSSGIQRKKNARCLFAVNFYLPLQNTNLKQSSFKKLIFKDLNLTCLLTNW